MESLLSRVGVFSLEMNLVATSGAYTVMRTFTVTVAGAVLAIGLAMSPAKAAPGGLAPLKSVTTSDSLVQKTHGWHRYCVTWRGWRHRHVRRGVVSCRPRARWSRYCYFNRRGVRVCVRR